MNRLDGKVALLSGGAQGMGAEHARAIVANGGSVVIGDVDRVLGQKLAEELGSRARFIWLDVRDAEDWTAAVSYAVRELGVLNVLINNAAILLNVPLRDCSDDQWELAMSVNLTGAFKGIRAAVPALSRDAPSSIINISSTSGFKGYAGFSAYSTAKWGLRGLTKNAAVELAESGIRVNSIHPGAIQTRMLDGHGVKFDHVPQRRAGHPAEVSNLVVFLASDESSFSTGSEFVVDGGELAGAPSIMSGEL